MSGHNGAMEGMIMVNSAEEIDIGKRRLELTEAGRGHLRADGICGATAATTDDAR